MDVYLMLLACAALFAGFKIFSSFFGSDDSGDETEEAESEEEQEEKEYETCEICKKKVEEDSDGYINMSTCSECDKTCCDDCCYEFENADTVLCKNCINKEYPREEKIVEKYIEKIVEIPTTVETKSKGHRETIL